MKLLCLDIDGVLNSTNYAKYQDLNNICMPRTFMLDRECVKLLNKIILRTECNILLTSTWRLDYKTPHGVNMFFESVGIKPVCIGLTEQLHTARGLEILSWLVKAKYINNYNFEGLAILDDDGDMELMIPWWLHCRNEIGLTNETAEEAIELLNKPFKLDITLGG